MQEGRLRQYVTLVDVSWREVEEDEREERWLEHDMEESRLRLSPLPMTPPPPLPPPPPIRDMEEEVQEEEDEDDEDEEEEVEEAEDILVEGVEEGEEREGE